MTARVIRPAISFGALGAAVLAVLSTYFALGTGTTRAEMFYTPETYVHNCNSLEPSFAPDPSIAGSGITDPAPAPFNFAPLCAENNATSVSPNITTYLNELGGDSNFSNVVTFVPNTYTIGTTVPAGTLMGGLRSNVNLGLLNGLCVGGANVEFALYNVPLPNSGTPQTATNIAWPQAEGTTNRFFQWFIGNGAGGGALTGGVPNQLSGANVNGTFALSTAAPLANYPGYLLNLFDPDFIPGNDLTLFDPAVGPADGPGGAGYTTNNSIIPMAVYGGVTNVAGTWTPLHFAQFASGALVPLGGINAGFVAGMGQPSQSVLNDPTAIGASPSTITDFCTPLTVSTMLLGDPAGAGVHITSPAAAGTAYHAQYASSLRDTDGDGRENAYDTCPTMSNAPAFTDTDSDRITEGTGGCDLTPGTDTAGICDVDGPGGLPGSPNSGDHDGDCFKNAQDNCPNVANATAIAAGPGHLDSELAGHNNNGTPNGLPSPDDGPSADTMGDVCDSEYGAPTISVTQNNQTVSITMDDDIANGRYLSRTNIVPKCIGGTDADGDGYCATQEGGQDANVVRHTAWTAQAALTAMTLDTDSDGWTDIRETYLNNNANCVTSSGAGVPLFVSAPPVVCAGTNIVPRTDPIQGCAFNVGANVEHPYDNWPLDYNDTGNANTTDVLTFVARLNDDVDGAAGPNTSPEGDERWDLNQDGIINTTDIISQYVTIPNLNKTCATALPVAVPPYVQQ